MMQNVIFKIYHIRKICGKFGSQLGLTLKDASGDEMRIYACLLLAAELL